MIINNIYSNVSQEPNSRINSNYNLLFNKIYIFDFSHKGGILVSFLLLLIITINIDLYFISNDIFFSHLKNLDYFLKEFDVSSYLGFMNKTTANNIQLINEQFYLYNIRKEINSYESHDYTNFELDRYFYYSKPKVSIIITVFNQEKYIFKIYSCLLNQSLKKIEILFIDDNSKDNSSLIIHKLMEKDKRILYIKNNANKGQFYSRNRGALLAKGDYVLVIDPDDLLLNNILLKSYKLAKKFNLDIIQYYHIMGSVTNHRLIVVNKNPGIFYYPESKNVFFNSSTRYLWDKLIRKEAFVKSISFMPKKFRKERFIIHNDETACFGIFRMANSYGQLDEVGYFYNTNNSNSTTKKNYLANNINGRFHSIFTIMLYYFEKSDDTVFEKTKGGYRFFEFRIVRKYKNYIHLLTKDFQYINNIIDIYLNSTYFNSSQRLLLINFKNKINIQKFNITHKNISFIKNKNF